MDNSSHIYTVSELNRHIRSLLEGRFPFISVSGEVSDLRKPYSGHLYFTLKDGQAQVKGVLFKLQQRYLAEPLQNGKQVICRGRISVYEARGDYQLIIDTVDFHGAGNLQAAFEQLKKKLATEGLFDEKTKKALPEFPSHITLITSPDGAAVHDFIKIARRRYPLTSITIAPVAVQGQQAAGEMIEAIRTVNNLELTDIVVLCRGGGSIEDLWCFNDEQLARAIRQSTIPVVSAVGHEIDFTIADFAADLRAPTPSGAAEMLLPDVKELQKNITTFENALFRALQRTIRESEHRFRYGRQRLSHMAHPVDTLLLKVSHLSMTLENNFAAVIEGKTQVLQEKKSRIERHNPTAVLSAHTQKLALLEQRMTHAISMLLQTKELQYKTSVGILDAVSPLATLARGYAIARKKDQKKTIITDAGQVVGGEKIELQVQHGHILCRVEPEIEN